MAEAISNYLKVGFEKINGHVVQVGIGDVNVGEKQVDVEVLPGCSIGGLTNAMKSMAKETHKPVKAVFNDREITIKPKH